MQDERLLTMMEKPKLFVSKVNDFVLVLKVAMKVAQENNINVVDMLKDVQKHDTLEERRARLNNWFGVV